MDLTGARVALAAQLGAGNAASEFQIRLADPQDDYAVYAFPLGSFNASAMSTAFLSAPTSLIGAVDFSQIRRFEVRGDFSSDDFLRLSIDRIEVISQADLAITKSDSPDPAVAGANLTYTL
ncbi:MAG: hypothetical protein JNJ76_14730, partial [Candidatus Competibacter sp.]|nr:hypothetical protein [Candidatus Competibacter sp.]